MSKKTCLIVDDNPETIDIVRFVLTKAGYEILVAFDGEKGLALAQMALPDLILLDLMMPVMDGYAMNEHLKADSKTKDIPVIIMTAKGGMEPMFSNGNESIRAYMIKPFSQKDLLSRIDEIFKKS